LPRPFRQVGRKDYDAGVHAQPAVPGGFRRTKINPIVADLCTSAKNLRKLRVLIAGVMAKTPWFAVLAALRRSHPLGSNPSARGICLANKSMLQSSIQHHVTRYILAKPGNPNRTIAIVIGHEQAYGVRDSAPPRNTHSFVARLEDLGDRQTRPPALTCSPGRLSEQGRLSIGGRKERVSVPNLIRLCDPLTAKTLSTTPSSQILQEGLRTPVRFTLGYAQKSPREGRSIDVGATGSPHWVLDST